MACAALLLLLTGVLGAYAWCWWLRHTERCLVESPPDLFKARLTAFGVGRDFLLRRLRRGVPTGWLACAPVTDAHGRPALQMVHKLRQWPVG